MSHQELHQTNGKNSNDSNNTNDISNNTTAVENSSESDEDMKLFTTRDQPSNDNEFNGSNVHNRRSSQSHLHSHQIHSKPIRKEKLEKMSSKRSMDDVLKRLNKYRDKR